MKMLSRRGVVVALLSALTLSAGRPVRAEGLDRELYKQSRVVFKFLRDHGYKNVGVLKFSVKKGNEPLSDKAGMLNLNIANRLEIALVLVDDLKDPIGIVHDASAVAARIPGANHFTRDGRALLFGGRYPLAWGKDQVAPDAFLTGFVEIRPDLASMKVGIVAIGKEGNGDGKVVEFSATPDPPVLIETGESYLMTRGGFDGGQPELTKAAAGLAAKVKSAGQPNPLKDRAAPVTLEIRYDGRPIPLEIRDNKALVREPNEGQQVSFVLHKADRTPDRYAVGLLVNGENTLYKDRGNPLNASKWVLGPDTLSITVNGFQTAQNKAEAFRVLSRAESAKKTFNYGDDVGTINLVVYREQKKQVDPPAEEDTAADFYNAIAGATFPGEQSRAENLSALRGQLLSRPSPNRGLIADGPEINASIRTVEFVPDPTPVMSATITYYKP